MDASTHELMWEQTGLYVLGALTSEERAAFEAHLTTCAECAAEVRALTSVAGALAQTAPQVDPPKALRDRVLSSVGAAPARQEDRAPRVVQMTPRRDAALPSWLAIAASLALAVVLGAYALQLRGRVSALEARLQEALLRADASERQIADARRVSFEAQSQVAVLTAPDLARVDLAGQSVAPSASARAFWSRSRGLVFTASSLPSLPPGRTYQLWFVAGKTPVSAGIFGPDADGRVNVLFTVAPDVPRPDVLAVTIEPAGGLPAPTGAMYLVGAVQTL